MILPALSADLGFGALVFPSVMRMRVESGELDADSTSGFCVRVTDPRAFSDVFERRFVRDEKNWR